MDTVIFFFIIFILGPKIVEKLGIKIKPIKAIVASLMTIGLATLSLSYVLYMGLPSKCIIRGNSLYLMTTGIGAIPLFLSGFLIFRKQQPNIEKPKQSTPAYSWILYSFTWFFIIISKYGFLFSIYSPKVFKFDVQVPELGVLILVAGNFLSASTLYYLSRFKHVKSPETYLWISLLTISYCIFETIFYGFVLVHGLVKDFNISYPYYASLVIIGTLPMISVMFSLAFRNDRYKDDQHK